MRPAWFPKAKSEKTAQSGQWTTASYWLEKVNDVMWCFRFSDDHMLSFPVVWDPPARPHYAFSVPRADGSMLLSIWGALRGIPLGSPGTPPWGIPRGMPGGSFGVPLGVPMGYPQGYPLGYPRGYPPPPPRGSPSTVLASPWKYFGRMPRGNSRTSVSGEPNKHDSTVW